MSADVPLKDLVKTPHLHIGNVHLTVSDIEFCQNDFINKAAEIIITNISIILTIVNAF